MLKELMESQKNDNINPMLYNKPGNKIGNSLDKVNQRGNIKRPARLLPSSLFRSPKNESADSIRRFYGPPTSCAELSKLGYTLNGYYHVKSGNIDDINQVETVYCQFKQPEGVFNSTGNEKRISTNKIGAVGTGVHFYAMLDSFDDTKAINTTIKFNDVKLNIGEAYDSKSGLFKVPKSGLYSFFFMGYITQGGSCIVLLWKNNTEQVGIEMKMGPLTPSRDVVIKAVLELKKGNTIEVKLVTIGRGTLSLLTLGGSLLQELE